ncbi:hypothetical protein KHA80_07765 [Anaerobacillus sp. HL2]|nr:hypothetical protein KHA80_07765 [Anaerobacillus sp. HL2]
MKKNRDLAIFMDILLGQIPRKCGCWVISFQRMIRYWGVKGRSIGNLSDTSAAKILRWITKKIKAIETEYNGSSSGLGRGSLFATFF